MNPVPAQPFRVTFIGGPLDGQTKTMDPQPITTKIARCDHPTLAVTDDAYPDQEPAGVYDLEKVNGALAYVWRHGLRPGGAV